MRSYQNPFRSRASEQHREIYSFLRYVGPGVLDLLPETVWDRPFIIRSASGGGKTTLLRLFTADALLEAHARRDDFPELVQRLEAHGAMGPQGPLRFGLLLNLARDYRTIASSGAPDDVTNRLFLRLLDARIVTSALRGALTLRSLSYPGDSSAIEFRPRYVDERVMAAIERLGGQNGGELLAAARSAEGEIVDLLDSLLPVDWKSMSRGHAELYSLRLLGDCDVFINGEALAAEPVLLLDDGHDLTPPQRKTLLRALLNRDVTTARWYAERFEALSAEELLVDGTSGRDYEVLELERAARRSTSSGRRHFDRLLRDVGNLRAGWHLDHYTHAGREFFDYFEPPDRTITPEIVRSVQSAALEAAAGHPSYEAWVRDADAGTLFARAVRLRSAMILIERYRNRPQQALFETSEGVPFDSLLPSNVKEAARLFLGREFDVPYYAGADAVVAVASQNIEQFLALCGDLFEHMLGSITLNASPSLDAERQQLIIRRASDRYWREVPERVPNAMDVMALLHRITAISLSESARSTAPYAPGVNGIAISMEDRARLLDPQTREQMPGGERLFTALGRAIARNVIIAEPNYSVKNTHVMVLYLNRLLCPKAFLPLHRGSFRERPVREVAEWLLDPTDPPQVLTETLF